LGRTRAASREESENPGRMWSEGGSKFRENTGIEEKGLSQSVVKDGGTHFDSKAIKQAMKKTRNKKTGDLFGPAKQIRKNRSQQRGRRQGSGNFWLWGGEPMRLDPQLGGGAHEGGEREKGGGEHKSSHQWSALNRSTKKRRRVKEQGGPLGLWVT